jgi:phosphotriesterase-related protein
MTVRGPVPAEAMGFTLPHEHVLVDLVRVFPANMLAFDFQLLDEELAIDEVGRFAKHAAEFAPGRPGLVDVTTDERTGRQPEALLRVAEALDLNLVMACGRYREPWFEPDFARRSTVDLAALFIDEIEAGVGPSGIRPGIIGELGADRDFVSPAEERVLRAAARAQSATGLAITLHARASRVALDQVVILEEAGADLRRVIVGHCDTVPDPDYHEQLARLGVWVEFDTIRGKVPAVVERRLDFIGQLRRRGFLQRLLLSHDNCALSHLRAYGNTGYDYLATGFLDRLRDAGLAEEELQMLFVRNPIAAIAIGP